MTHEALLSWEQFESVDMRAGTVLHAEILAKAKKPAYKLTIDFGPLGIKRSSAQITHRYQAQQLIGRQVIAVVNFPPKQIADCMSECLVLGVYEGEEVIVLQPEQKVSNGNRIG